jgi:hypothetical protein
MIETTADHRVGRASPRSTARLIALFSLLVVAGGIYSTVFVGERTIVWRDAAATAANILAHRNLYLSGVAVFFVEMACNIVTTALYYVLLKPAGRSLALVAAALGFTACLLKTGARVLFAAPAYLLGSTRFHALGPEAVNELSLAFLLVNDHAAGIAMAFFGFHALLDGVLILKSTFLPRFLGVLSIVCGLSWLTHLWPPLGYRLGRYLIVGALLGLVVQTFWFLVFGVNEERWHEQARSSR